MDALLGKHFVSLFLILLFSIRLSSHTHTKEKDLRYFWLTVVSCFLLVLQEMAEVVASKRPELIFWRTLLTIAGYFLMSTATVGLVLVVRGNDSRSWAMFIPCIINLLVCCTAFFSDIAFGFDEEYHFYRGPLGYIAFIVPIMYMFMLLWTTFRHYLDRYQRGDRMILLTCAVFCLMSTFLDATRGGVRVIEAILISSIFFYVFLRSYDVRRDSLTMLLNRQSLYDDCAAWSKSICAAASVDMNGLKRINDTRGHSAGDTALQEIGSVLLETENNRTRPYRIGGDEFVILFTKQDEDDIRDTLENIQEKVNETGYSVSCGYAMRQSGEDTDALIQRADMKMFEQKAKYYQDRNHNRRRGRSGDDDAPLSTVTGILENLPQPLAVWRFEHHRVEPVAVSNGFLSLFGHLDRSQAMYVMDHDMYTEVHPVDRERFSGAMLRFSEGKEDLDIVYRATGGPDSGYHVIHARGTHVHTATGAPTAYIWYMDEGTYVEGTEEAASQVTRALSRALHEESILHSVHYDTLTGLPNLAWFFKLCEAGKARILDEGGHACLLYMDLNGMKIFNHRHGFAEGDKLLKAFSDILVHLFGKENCCHIGADRFAVCASDRDLDRKIQQCFTEARQMNSGRTLPVRVGIYSSELEDVPVSSAYDRAKIACDAIRQSDVSIMNRYNVDLRDEERRRRYLVANIDRAVSERWIQVYYQPIVRAVGRKVCHEEALARWVDPVVGFLSANDFIPILEQSGLIYKLDLCVLDQVLEKIKSHYEPGMVVVPHSINLSRSDFDVCDIVEEIRKRVDDAGVPRSTITIEITESIIASNLDFMREQVVRFRELGFPVWMDDFGNGYSSLDVLQSIPFDLIKFDMSFMKKMDSSENTKIILTELVKMATFLNVDTICEGVETEEQVRFLQEIGCSRLQGFYFSPPISLQKLREKYIAGSPIGFEAPEVSPYYEAIGRVNLYDLDVLANLDENLFQHAFNTLPMAILEIRGSLGRYIRSTPSYRKFLQRFPDMDMDVISEEFVAFSDPFTRHAIELCHSQGNRFFFDEKLPDGSTVHTFVRRIGENPVNGDCAFAVAVLSVSESGSTTMLPLTEKGSAEKDM